MNSLKLAGTYAVSIRSVSLKESGGRDVTANYEFTFVDTEVTVLPRPITVTAASGVFYYDGNTHYANELEPNYYVTFDGDPSENGIVEGDQVYQSVI